MKTKKWVLGGLVAASLVLLAAPSFAQDLVKTLTSQLGVTDKQASGG